MKMRMMFTSLILIASATHAHALNPSYVVTTNNAERLGIAVTVQIAAGTGTVSRVTVGVKSKASIARHEASLVIRSQGTLLASIPLRHLGWRTDQEWITEFQLQSSLVADTAVILDAVPETGPRYEINLADWTKSPNNGADHIR